MEKRDYGELVEIRLRYEQGEIIINPHEIENMLNAAEALEKGYKAVQTAKRISSIHIDEMKTE